MWVVIMETKYVKNHAFNIVETLEEAEKSIEEFEKYLKENNVTGYNFRIESL